MEIPMEKPKFDKPHIDEGVYDAVLKDLKDIGPGKFGDRLAFVFWIADKNIELGKVVYKKATPNSELTKVYITLGGQFEEGKSIDTASLVGKGCRVFVEDYYLDNGEKASTVSKVRPLKETTEEKVIEEEIVEEH